MAVQWLRLSAFTATGSGSIPGQGAKSLQTTLWSQKKKKKEKKRKKEIPWKKNEQNLLLDSTEGGMRQTTAKMLPSFAAWGNGHRRREREGCDGFSWATWHVGSWFPEQGSNPHPLQWQHSVLTTGPPGKSQGKAVFLKSCSERVMSNISWNDIQVTMSSRQWDIAIQVRNISRAWVRRLRLGTITIKVTFTSPGPESSSQRRKWREKKVLRGKSWEVLVSNNAREYKQQPNTVTACFLVHPRSPPHQCYRHSFQWCGYTASSSAIHPLDMSLLLFLRFQ